MKKLIFLLVITLISFTYVKAQTPIDNSYFATNLPVYTWDFAGSPYYIVENIEIPQGSNLIIEPNVEILFQGHYKIDVKGSINAIGNASKRITFTSDASDSWNGIRFDFSDNPNPTPSKLHYCDISNARKKGTICTSPDSESSGGAIYVVSFSDLEIYECEIFNNVVLAQGGAIGIYSNSSPKIWKCNIHNNSALRRGGGICMMVDCSPIITDNIIEENVSISRGGGAIAIGNLSNSNPCYPIVNSNYIVNNYAFEKGGGVFICNSNPTEFKNNIFEENTAQGNGGGIHIRSNSTVYLENNIFINNQSIFNGGGICIGAYGPNVSLNACQFSGNSAENGGGLYQYFNSISDIRYSNFINNTASTNGGGIYVFNSTSTIEKCSFEENTATANGGGVFMNDPIVNSIDLNSFKYNTAYQGSALYYLRYTNSTTKSIKNNLFVENHATDMGVVYMQGNNNNTIFNHNTISNNTATSWISGVCVDYDANFPDVLNSQNFHNNIIYEAIVDVYITNSYQQPSNYSTLAGINYLNYDNAYNQNPSPGFVSSTDYHLTSSSPCRDAGINSAPMTTNDLDGNQQISNNITDYGCYEYGSISPARRSNPNSSNLNGGIAIYPNPATDFLIINTYSEQNINISLYSLSGQRVYSSENSLINGEKIISLSDFKPGAYIIKLQTQNTTLNKRIIVQ